jgi:tetratricopeptide (TPR) repeat protein
MSATGPRFERAGGLAEIDDPTRVLFERTLEEIERDDAKLAEIVRLCVIPRRVDPAVVGALRRTDPADPGNAEVMDLLAGLDLVDANPDGSLAFRSRVRDRLLRDWRSEESPRRATFEAVTGLLVDHYAAQHDAALTLAHDLSATAHVMRTERNLQLSGVVEARLREPLLEALYHETLRSPQAGLLLFERAYTAHEREMRYGICAALLGEAQIQVTHLYPHDVAAHQLRWLRYWEARLVRALNQFEEAEEILRDLVDESGDDAKLRLWAGGELGSVLQQRYKLREALEVYFDGVAHAETTDVDPWNTPVAYLCLGTLYRIVGDLPNAIDALETALALAEGQENESVQANALINLAEARNASGRHEAAFEPALRAFDLARTSLRVDRGLQGSVSGTFMGLVARLEPRLLDTIRLEGRTLAATMGDALPQLELDNRYADELRDCGRLTGSEAVLDELELRARRYGNQLFEDTISLTRGLVEEQRGRLRTAIDIYARIGPNATLWSRAAVHSNRGHDAIELFELDDAERDLEAARALWSEMGCEVYGALMDTGEAEIRLLRGDAAGAHAALDRAEPTLEALDSRYRAACHDVRAKVLEREGRWKDAIEQQQLALELQTSFGDLRARGGSLTRLSMLSARVAEHAASARWARAATKELKAIAERDAYSPTTHAEEADDDNARGMLKFSSGGADHARAVQARDHLRSAVARVPENFWYSLNLAYICASIAEWAEAMSAMEAALRHGPHSLATPVLHERLAEWRLRHGNQLHAEAAYAEAAQVFDDGFSGLAGAVSDAQLAIFAIGAGDSLLKQGSSAAARHRYEQGAALLDEESALRARFEERLGIVDAVSGDPTSAVERFGDSLALAGRSADSFWQIVEQCSSLTAAAARPLVEDALRMAMQSTEIGGRMTRFSPTLSVPLPPDWSAKESITLTAPDGQANLVASSEPVPPDLSTHEYAEKLAAALTEEELPGYRVISFEPTVLSDGREAWMRRFEWDPPESPSISQVQLYYVADARGYTATATTPVTEVERYDLELGQLLEGLRLSRAAAT